MDTRTEDADKALDAYTASRTAEGRFLSYCRGRARNFVTRQVTVAVLFPVFVYIGGFQVAVLAAVVSVSGEALDCFVLRRYGACASLQHKLPLAMGITTVTAGIQALTNIFCVGLIYILGGSDARTMAGAACFAAILDAALHIGAHRNAAIVRILLFVTCIIMIIRQEMMSTAGMDTALVLDSLSFLFLLSVCWLIVRHVLETRERRVASKMAILEKSRELAHTNAALVRSRQTTKRLAMVAERANDSVIITDADGVVSWVNQAFSKATGYSFSDAVGRNPAFLNGPQTDPAASEALQRARLERTPVRLEIMNQRSDGSSVWFEVNMNPVFDDRGELINVVSIERDIGEAKEREAALAEARRKAEDAVRARRNFLATMSHEIRTPMNGVIGTTDLLLETDLDTQQHSLVRTINASGEALLAIIDDILDFSKLEAGRLEVDAEAFSPSECFRSAVELVQPIADAKGLQLNLVMASSMPETLVGDGRRISQVLLNLLGNALKFTETGHVDVDVSVRLEAEKCHLLISVRDTGIGIPANRLDSIFESFVQADSSVAGRFGGTGLGLAISRLLVNAMGGEISVASTLAEGSTFYVSLALPIAEDEVLQETADPEEKVERSDVFSQLKVLVAEDNRTNTLLIDRMLDSVGVKPVFAINGREASEFFESCVPDIVLMDVHMPILNGLDATRRIRAFEQRNNLHRVPIVALTANAFPEDRDSCLDAGMDGIVTKPFRKRDLLSALLKFAIGTENDVPGRGAESEFRRSG